MKHSNFKSNWKRWNKCEIDEEKSLSNALFASKMMLSFDVLIDIKHKAQTGVLVLFGQAQTLILSY